MDAVLRIKKIVKAGNKKREVLKRLMRHGHDLMVIGFDRKPAGLFSFRRNISENLADNFGNTTLFLPRGSRSFVDENSGKVTLNSVIIPVKSSAFLEPALQSIKMLQSIFPSIVPHITCVHAGTKFPKMCSTTPGISWDEKLSTEMPVTAILNSARSSNADLIIMVTQGRNSWSNYLAGSLTEQVLRKSPCPVLAITLKRDV
jgi:nucleotide-binding universal stress UspA family protein